MRLIWIKCFRECGMSLAKWRQSTIMILFIPNCSHFVIWLLMSVQVICRVFANKCLSTPNKLPVIYKSRLNYNHALSYQTPPIIYSAWILVRHNLRFHQSPGSPNSDAIWNRIKVSEKRIASVFWGGPEHPHPEEYVRHSRNVSFGICGQSALVVQPEASRRATGHNSAQVLTIFHLVYVKPKNSSNSLRFEIWRLTAKGCE